LKIIGTEENLMMKIDESIIEAKKYRKKGKAKNESKKILSFKKAKSLNKIALGAPIISEHEVSLLIKQKGLT
jgi:hypothetical protein